MIDQRLLGSWKSDKRRTLQELRKFKGFPEKTIQLLGKKIYGRLIHRWERGTLKTSMGGAFSSQEFSVVAKDETSVAVMIAADPESWKTRIIFCTFALRGRICTGFRYCSDPAWGVNGSDAWKRGGSPDPRRSSRRRKTSEFSELRRGSTRLLMRFARPRRRCILFVDT